MSLKEPHSYSLRRRFFWLSFAATLLIYLAIGLVSAPLINAGAPTGIVSFELAGTPDRAQQILATWDEYTRRYAAFSLGFDYLFMLAYASTLALACVWAGEVLQERDWPFGHQSGLFASAAVVAAFFDIVENLGLSLILLESWSSPWPQIARFCAFAKFLLLSASLVYVFLGLVVFLVGRLVRTASHSTD